MHKLNIVFWHELWSFCYPFKEESNTDVVMLDSVLQGEDLHARLTNPRGLMIKNSILLEKTKLEEEVKLLQVKITELER